MISDSPASARSTAAILRALLMGACACSAAAAIPHCPDIPAVIVDPNAESRKELHRVVRDARFGGRITLADDALTASNVLSLEHANARDPSGRPANGRDLSRPETFELFLRAARCILVQSRTGREWTLRHIRCAPMQR